jgi:arylsulfatase A-like enzyme
MRPASVRPFPAASLLLAFAALANLPSARLAAAAPARPNILLVFTDQQHARAMSAAGNPHLRTPHLDALARRGVRFTQAYCTSPVCGPSRASLVTGLMPSEAGVDYNDQSLRPEVPTVGELLRAAGYRTVWAGKWHLPESYPQRAAAKGARREIRGFEVLPFWDPQQPRWMLGAETDPPLTDAVVDFLARHDRRQPLLLAVSYHNPHDICFFPRKAGWETDTVKELEIRHYGFKHRLPEPIGIHPDQLTDLPPLPANFRRSPDEPEFLTTKRLHHDSYGVETRFAATFTPREWQAYLNAYYRLTERVDAEIGRLLAAVRRHGYDDNTLIVFTSDHGDGAAAHEWAAKLSLYQESVNVPLIVVPPGGRAAGRVDDRALVSLADLVPTFCEVAGITPPPRLAGRSLRPLLTEPAAPWRDFLVTELADYKPDPSRRGRLVRTARYKYNHYTAGRNPEQLFDLAADPGEVRNLAADPAHHASLEEHRRLLRAWVRERGDTYPPAAPAASGR